MENFIYQIVENNQLIKSLENLEQNIWNISKHSNTQLGFSLKLASLLAETVHLKLNLSALLKQWRDRLPFIGELGTEVNWSLFHMKFCAARGEINNLWGYYDFPDFHIFSEHPEGQEWQNWESDEWYEKKGISIVDTNEYRKNLSPTNKHNTWFFCGDSYEKFWKENHYTDSDTECIKRTIAIRRGLRTFAHYEDTDSFVNLLEYEIDQIIKIIDKLHTCINNPTKFLSSSLFITAIQDFFDRLLGPVEKDNRVPGAKQHIDEFREWQDSYGKDMQINVLIARQKKEFLTLLDSGFLDPFLTDHDISHKDVDSARMYFDEYFFFNTQNIKDKRINNEAAGRYIYFNQFRGIDWRKKVVAFLCFLRINDWIENHILIIDEYFDNDSLRLERQEIVIKHCIKHLYCYLRRKARNKNISSQYWWVVYRVLVDDGSFGVLEDKYKEFEKKIYKLFPKGLLVSMPKYFRDITKRIFQLPVKFWNDPEMLKIYEKKNEPDYEMIDAAKHFSYHLKKLKIIYRLD